MSGAWDGGDPCWRCDHYPCTCEEPARHVSAQFGRHGVATVTVPAGWHLLKWQRTPGGILVLPIGGGVVVTIDPYGRKGLNTG